MTGTLKFIFLLLLLVTSGCQGSFSTLNVAGSSNKIISEIFWWMLGGSVVIWIIFTALALYSYFYPHPHDKRRATLFIVGGGVVFPVIILSVLLYFSLTPLPELLRPAPAGSLTIEVSGLQWWWRVRYLKPDGSKVELANEIRLPVNEPVKFILTSEDVIHSFWIPPLGGKMDMIPGHVNQLSLIPTKTGIFSSVCAEYCGASHALMQMKVVVSEKKVFDEWLKAQSLPAVETVSPVAMKGKIAFRKYGCVACHTVRGLSVSGLPAPDLTHIGSRLTIGAGILPNDISSFHKWLRNIQNIKPGVKMPAFGMIPKEDLDALSLWLKELK